MREALRLRAENEQLAASNRALTAMRGDSSAGLSLTGNPGDLKAQEDLAASYKMHTDLVKQV